MNTRRQCLLSIAAALPASIGHAQASQFEKVRPDYRLQFPRDFGAHPAFRTEWWYLTGQAQARLRNGTSTRIGFQVTFFRSRTDHSPDNPSRLSPSQLLLAHAAVCLPAEGYSVHAQLAARAGRLKEASFSELDTALRLGDWSMLRSENGYQVKLRSSSVSMQLLLETKAGPILQGRLGVSRKGPQPEQTSYYYSRPQLIPSGTVTIRRAGTSTELQLVEQSAALPNRAWLDHEWSSTLLDAKAVGWDWIGINFLDGSSLMAFRLRKADGSTLWSHWARHGADQSVITEKEGQDAVSVRALRSWRSSRSGASYPVDLEWRCGSEVLQCYALLDDQELDTRASTGTIYWEGAIRCQFADAVTAKTLPGQGYLELTGYTGAIRI